MVFESVVANLLNTYLGHFIDDVNASQLQLGVWKGNVELKDLAIKEDAFSTLDLPFKVVHGHVGKLTAVVPWSSLYSSPVKLSLEDVFVVAVPNVLEEYDEETEIERAWQIKKNQLILHETTKKNLEAQAEQKLKKLNEVAQEDDGFATKLAAQVIRNVQIFVNNIHIVYEDRFTDPSVPFQVGLTLKSSVFQTVDDSATNQNNKYSDIHKKELVFKVTEINHLAAYFNCENGIHFLTELLEDRDEIDIVLRKRIESTLNKTFDKNMDFILKPVTFKGNLVINSKPEKFNFQIPVSDVDLLLGEFTVHLKKKQIHCITSFLESLNRIRIASAFRKFRPSTKVSSNPDQWWQFALSSVLERDIKPRRNNWNWKRMKKHRQLCREYKELYKEKLLCKSVAEKIGIDIEMEKYERQLDVFNIILSRRQAEIECKPELDKIKANEADKKGSWLNPSSWGFGGWLGDTSAKAEQEKEAIVTDLKREMTQEEKEKLYYAIGYDSTSVGVLDTPKEFVGFIVNFKVDSIKAMITGFDENFRLGEFCMKDINFSIQYRPAAGAAHVYVSFGETFILTSSEDPSIRGKTSSIENRRRALAFSRSTSKQVDDPNEDFELHLESKNFKFECTYEPKQDDVSIALESTVEDIQLTITKFIFYKTKLPTEIKYYVLKPCTIKMNSHQEGDKQVMHLGFSELDVRMAPQAWKLVTTVIGAFGSSGEVKIVERDPPSRNEILLPKLLSRDSKYRPKDIVDAAIEVTEDMNLALRAAVSAASLQKQSSLKVFKREIYLDMRSINFVVENSVVNPQPLIRFHSAIFGRFVDSKRLKLECQCLLNYYNEDKRSWEPMIEPVRYNPYPNGQPISWKFDLTLQFKQVNNQPVMNIELESRDNLDLTITRTAINVLLSLLDSLSEENENRQEYNVIKALPAPATKSKNKAMIKFRNLLPFCIKYNIVGREEVHELGAGEEGSLDGIKFGQTQIRVKLTEYLSCSWVADSTINGLTEDEDFDTWKFYPCAPTKSSKQANKNSLEPLPYHPGHRRTDSTDEYSLTLLVATSKDDKGQIISSLFSPYWLINKTHQSISWNFSNRKGYSVTDPGDLDYPVLMSYKQSLFSKKRMHIKVSDSDFSDGFPVDSVGSKGSVLVKGKDGTFYVIAVHIAISRIGLTKIVSLHPFYLVLNKTKSIIEFSEDNDEFTVAMPKDATPFWPYKLKDLKLFFRFGDSPEHSSRQVSLTTTNATLLVIRDKLVYVTVEVEENEVQITLEDYFEGCSPVLFVNATDDCVLAFRQTNCNQRTYLQPMHAAHFTWQDPLGARTVLWSINDYPEQTLNPTQDSSAISEDKETCWVSFVDGSQRVFLVTHDFSNASDLSHAIELVQPQMEIILQSKGFGLSLVDDIAGLEIAYMGIAPSDLIWEIKFDGKRYYQPLPIKDIEIIEAAYKKQLARSTTTANIGLLQSRTTRLGRKIKIEWPEDVNQLERPKMLEPNVGKLRRVQDRGFWGYIGYSEHTTQLHFKISHMQIDNQMSDCMFSTIMSQQSNPRSVVGDQVPKPFFEISAVIQRQANLRRFKYLRSLIQEFFIKIEYSFVQHLMEFSNEASTWYYRNYTYKEMIENDLHLVLNSHETLVESMTRSNRVLYDLIHFSPLKLNVSFSLSSSTSTNSKDQKDDGVTLPFGLDFILRSAGVTLTEFQDVTFKLDCFERNMVLFTEEQLMWASIDHYKRQILKQFYAIVLGLDVIGNPVSLMMDLKQGVNDFFYEPIQGIIKGPEEAVEGIVIGVHSLFSHTVGGTIGALSKISGTLGDGMSSLTFDDDLKRRRRLRRREQPNIARSGRDLVEGFVGGITNLVKQPVSGAKEDGFEGFVKGVGKGVVGVVTQPATSIVDFATGTLKALKFCVNEDKGPSRLRPPRVIVVGKPLRPYNRYEADLLNNPRKKDK